MNDSKKLPDTPGVVYTFYSYKGGVGRSMAVANVGALMALSGYRVLLVDWDLEAPGLEQYFTNKATIIGDTATLPGIVDLIEAHAENKPISWRECCLKANFLEHSLDLLSSGSRTSHYRRRVQSLDWRILYEEHQIGNYIDSLRTEWRREYDFVLVDSRTGMTDVVDICTAILPDVLVLLFVTNQQNVTGIKDTMARALKARSAMPVNRSKLLAVPVPARTERDKEYDMSTWWHNYLAEQFGGFYREWLPKEVTPKDALNRLFLPYIPNWSFGERLPVIESERELADPTTLGTAYSRLATLLTHRLDWSALDARASNADLLAARVELSAVREREKEKDIKLKRTRSQNFFDKLVTVLVVGAALYGVQYFRKPSDKDTPLVPKPSLAEQLQKAGYIWDADKKEVIVTSKADSVNLIGNPLYKLAPQSIKFPSLHDSSQLADYNYLPLKHIDIGSSLDLGSLDALKNFPTLASFSVGSAPKLTNLDGLKNLTALSKLDLSGATELRNVDALTNLNTLTQLSLSGAQNLRNLDGLKNLPGLTTLDLSRCTALQNVDGLKNLPGLTTVDLSHCTALENVGGLKNLLRLTTLNLSYCTALQSVDSLKNLAALRKLDLSGCEQISKADLVALHAALRKCEIKDP